MSARAVIVSVVLHVVVAGALLASAKTGTLHRPTAIALISEPQAKPKPAAPPKPKPPAPPKHEPRPTETKAVPAPAPAPSASPFAALASLEMSNDDIGPGAVTVPVPRAAAPRKVASLGPDRGRGREGRLGPCTEPPTKPQPIYEVEIEYLASDRAEGVEGRLVLRIFVAADGSVAKVDVLSPVEPALDAAAIAAVKQWRFKPAMACGRAVDGGVYTIARRFELGD